MADNNNLKYLLNVFSLIANWSVKID